MISPNLLEMQKKQDVLNKRLLREKEPWGPDYHNHHHTSCQVGDLSPTGIRCLVCAMEITLPCFPSGHWAVVSQGDITWKRFRWVTGRQFWAETNYMLAGASILFPSLRVRHPSLSYTIRMEAKSESRQGDLILPILPFWVLWAAPPASLLKTHSIVSYSLSFLLANPPPRKELINPCSY